MHGIVAAESAKSGFASDVMQRMAISSPEKLILIDELKVALRHVALGSQPIPQVKDNFATSTSIEPALGHLEGTMLR